MTEKTAITASHAERGLSPARFLIALVLGPLVFTALTFWLYVPIFALLLGGPWYLAFGFPAGLFAFRRRRFSTPALICLALIVNGAMCAGLALTGLVTGDSGLRQTATIYALYGSVFAALWALASGLIYAGFTK